MDYNENWFELKEATSKLEHREGGQGKISIVVERSKYETIHRRPDQLVGSLKQLTTARHEPVLEENYKIFKETVKKIYELEDSANWGALKILHEPKDAVNAEVAEERMMREIKAMSEISHPNLIQILDYDPDSKWFVASFYPNGALSQNLSLYKGNILAALKAFRPIVEGVVKIHEAGFVHRDINPRNIFIDKEWSLILGDFGLVFFDDDDRTRLSNTFENVGSRDSMPGWASGIRIDEIKPTFDIYSLGKLIWSMISGIPVLQREYWNTESNDLTKIFPDNNQMIFVNNLLASCVVESQEDCLGESAQFLDNVDTLIDNLESNVQPISENIERKCFTCGKGIYKMKSDGNQAATQNMGLMPTGSKRIKIYACDNCGHMQLFYLPNGNIPPAWLEKLGES